jgi:hypothetical protein
MEDIILDDYIFRCFTESLKPYSGRLTCPDVISWIVKNHVGSISLAIRRLDDNDGRTVSLRRLLIEMQGSADIITEGNLEKYCGIKLGPSSFPVNVREAIQQDLFSLDEFCGQVKAFVNTRIAHCDSSPSAIPTFDALRLAIDCYHSIYRKWAYIFTGMSFQRYDPNPMNLVPEIEDDYSAQFSMMWKCLFDDEAN